MRLVVVESPYAGGDRERNARYLRSCLLDCLRRGEAPFASHRLYPGALDDDQPEERALGIAAGNAWRVVAEATVVYMDLGVSPGMRAGIADAERLPLGHRVEYRRLGAWS